MTVEIKNGNNAWVDIAKYIKFQGITFSRNDVEAPEAGRDLSGLMHRGRVAIKERIDITTVPLGKADIAAIHALILPVTIEVRVTPYPNTNAAKTMTMYSNNIKTNYIIYRENGEEIQSITFPLVEV